jgi:hypothetical protein
MFLLLLPYVLATMAIKQEVIAAFDMKHGVPSIWPTAVQQALPPPPVGPAPLPPVASAGTEGVTPQQTAAHRFATFQHQNEMNVWSEQCKLIMRANFARKEIVEDTDKMRVYGLIVSKLSHGVKEAIGRSDAGKRALDPTTPDLLELMRALHRMMMGSDLTLPGAESVEQDERNASAAWESLKQRSGESIEALAERAKLARATLDSAKAQLLQLHAAQRLEGEEDVNQGDVEEELLKESTYAPISDADAALRFIKALASDTEFWAREPHKAFAIAEFHRQKSQGNTSMTAQVYRRTHCASIDAVVERLNQLFQIHLTTPDPASLALKFAKERLKADTLGVYAAGLKPRGDGKHRKQRGKGNKGVGAKDDPDDDDDAGGGGGKTDETCYACHKPGHRWADGVCSQGKAKLKRLGAKSAAGPTQQEA